MKRIFTKEVKIGLCVIIALAILFFGINFLKGVNIFKAANYYYADYENVEGLTVSTPVTINGYKVGQVREIEYDFAKPGKIRVEMSVDRELKVPVGSKAVLTSDLLGTTTILLKLSDNTQYCSVGDLIEGINDPGMMGALSNDLLPSVSKIFPKIDSLLTSVNALVANPALQTSISRLDNITADLNTSSAQLAIMTKGLAPLPGRISPILNDVQNITGNVSNITSDVSKLTSQLKELPLDSLLDNIKATTDNLRVLSEQLNDPNSTIGKLTSDPQLYDNINHTINSLDSLFIDIKKNPKRYVTVKVF